VESDSGHARPAARTVSSRLRHSGPYAYESFSDYESADDDSDFNPFSDGERSSSDLESEPDESDAELTPIRRQRSAALQVSSISSSPSGLSPALCPDGDDEADVRILFGASTGIDDAELERLGKLVGPALPWAQRIELPDGTSLDEGNQFERFELGEQTNNYDKRAIVDFMLLQPQLTLGN
jgi:hypothetical protein